jgi:nucleolar protein 16
MGRELQKKKNRAKVPKIKKKRKLLQHGNKKINMLGNALIAENWSVNEAVSIFFSRAVVVVWVSFFFNLLLKLTVFCFRDKSLTLMQNYRRLGLTSRLNTPTGGVEKRKAVDTPLTAPELADPLHITGSAKEITKTAPDEVRVERDLETGKIIRVVRDDEIEIAGHKRWRSNPLGDPLSELFDTEKKSKLSAASSSSFVQKLELQATQEAEAMTKKRPRQQSKREEEWIARLVERYKDDVRAMARDRKLNPMQQTEGDLRRRICIWKKRQS